MVKKSASKIVSEAYDEIEKLKPTTDEIQAYANLHENDYGVVTYSKSEDGDNYFLRFHNTWKEKSGGRVHVDLGFVDEDEPADTNTTHLMLDKDHAPDFVKFVKKRRQEAVD